MSDLTEKTIKIIYYYDYIYGNLKQIGLYPEKRKQAISKTIISLSEQERLEDELYNIMILGLK